MVKLLLYIQSAVCFFCVLISAFWGISAAISALLGGMAYVLPTMIAGLILRLSAQLPQLSALVFFIAEGVKIGLAILFMVAAFFLYQDLQWPPFLFALIAVSCSVFFVIGKINDYGSRTGS